MSNLTGKTYGIQVDNQKPVQAPAAQRLRVCCHWMGRLGFQPEYLVSFHLKPRHQAAAFETPVCLQEKRFYRVAIGH